jgi:hypothetical protein
MSTKLMYYTTEKGLLVRLKADYPDKHRINDKPLTPTFHPRWWIVEGEQELRSYSVHAGQKRINGRYRLINDAVEGVQKVIAREDVEHDDEGRWAGRHAGLDLLYQYEYETEDLGFAPMPFEPDGKGKLEFERLGNPTNFSYKVHGEGYDRDGNPLGYKNIFQHIGWMDARIGKGRHPERQTPTRCVGAEVGFSCLRSQANSWKADTPALCVWKADTRARRRGERQTPTRCSGTAEGRHPRGRQTPTRCVGAKVGFSSLHSQANSRGGAGRTTAKPSERSAHRVRAARSTRTSTNWHFPSAVPQKDLCGDGEVACRVCSPWD